MNFMCPTAEPGEALRFIPVTLSGITFLAAGTEL